MFRVTIFLIIWYTDINKIMYMSKFPVTHAETKEIFGIYFYKRSQAVIFIASINVSFEV